CSSDWVCSSQDIPARAVLVLMNLRCPIVEHASDHGRLVACSKGTLRSHAGVEVPNWILKRHLRNAGELGGGVRGVFHPYGQLGLARVAWRQCHCPLVPKICAGDSHTEVHRPEPRRYDSGVKSAKWCPRYERRIRAAIFDPLDSTKRVPGLD